MNNIAKKYVIFGAGHIGRNVARILGAERIICFCDNGIHKKNDTVDEIKIVSANDLDNYIDENTEILIATTKSKNVFDISMQLYEMGKRVSFYEDVLEDFMREDINKYNKLNNRESFSYDDIYKYIITADRFENAGSVHSYFWQDLWAAKRIFSNRVDMHYDIGSRLDGFISHLLSYGQKVRMLDIRPLEVSIDDLDFRQEDATLLSGIKDGSISSLSALCSLEHFGLGRYGDAIDPEACFKAFHAIQKKMSVDGRLYISVPIGIEHLEFNAHRVFSPNTIVQEFDEMELVEFSSCYKEEYEENISINKYDNWSQYGGDRFGLFYFIKRGIHEKH